MKWISKFIWIGLLALSISPVLAASDCPQVVQQALAATNQLCDSTNRNEACYGHVSIQAQPQPGIQNFSFSFAGDRVDLTSLQSLQMSQMEADTGNWGVALMRLQANLAPSDKKDLTLLAFGDVKIENQVQAPTRLDVNIAGKDYANVRQSPSTSAGVLASIAPSQAVTALERLKDNSWVRVEIPDSGNTGWVNASLITSAGDINSLNVVDSPQPYYRPMQSFYFESGDTNAGCSDMPANGLLIQTPEGVGEVKLLINEVNIHLGSTVFFESQPGKFLTVTTLEGHARVQAFGIEYTAVAGTQVQVPLDANGHPSGPPTLPQPSDASVLQTLPIGILDRPITVVPPLDPQAIVQVQQQESSSTCPVTCDVQNQDNNQSVDCPGNSCNAPGQNPDSCPGNSCNAPGQNPDSCPGNSCNSNAGGNGNGNGNGNGKP